jgi:hypothetical protein
MIDLGACTLGDRGLVASTQRRHHWRLWLFDVWVLNKSVGMTDNHVGILRDLTALWEDSPPVFLTEYWAEWTKSVRANTLRVLGAFRNATTYVASPDSSFS